MQFKRLSILTFLFLLTFSLQAHAYDVSLKAGVASGQSDSMAYSLDIEHQFEPFIEDTGLALSLITNIGGFVWHNSADTVYGGAVTIGLKFSFGTYEQFRPYISGTIGPSLISENRFDNRDLGGAFQWRSKAALGFMFGAGLHHSLEINATHFSHARILGHDNDGYTAFGLAYAYTF